MVSWSRTPTRCLFSLVRGNSRAPIGISKCFHGRFVAPFPPVSLVPFELRVLLSATVHSRFGVGNPLSETRVPPASPISEATQSPHNRRAHTPTGLATSQSASHHLLYKFRCRGNGDPELPTDPRRWQMQLYERHLIPLSSAMLCALSCLFRSLATFPYSLIDQIAPASTVLSTSCLPCRRGASQH